VTTQTEKELAEVAVSAANALVDEKRHYEIACTEIARLKARIAELEAQAAKVAEFVAARAEYITAIRNCHPDNGHDYDRWQGHAAARRQLAETLGLPVAWPAKEVTS
jgi:hypothetical protein